MTGYMSLRAKRSNLVQEEIMYYVYILTNKTNRVLYTGVTNDLLKRIEEHKAKLNPKLLLQDITYINWFL